MSNFLLDKSFFEHDREDISSIEGLDEFQIVFKDNDEAKCIEIIKDQSKQFVQCSYYIGVDWLLSDKLAISVSPKLNDAKQQIDYLGMLFSCLRHPDIAGHTIDLYEIKFEQPSIQIEHIQDRLTPVLIMQFLYFLKTIVKKGLKKSYYRVDENLTSKIKGKVIVSKTLKDNIFKNKHNQTYCNYEQFGYNGIENRLLKHTLTFIQKYINLYPQYVKITQPIINFCAPAFYNVDDIVDLKSIKTLPLNSFYQEYKDAIHIANLILKRFGYNLHDVISQPSNITKVPPFWIDMAKLFELYVLGLLKDRYGHQIFFQQQGKYGQPDFLLITEDDRVIIDTKYKSSYQKDYYKIEDIRQISGYARDREVLSKLGYKMTQEQIKIVDCIIIYPDQYASESLPVNLKELEIKQFVQFYKIPIKLPTIYDSSTLI